MDKQILKIIADNPNLQEALRSVLEKQFELNKLSVDSSDLALGQAVRGHLVGLAGVDLAFKEIAQYKSRPEEPPRFNEAR